MLPLSSLILPRTHKLTGSLFLTHWKSCFWIVMETEGIPKGLEPSLDPYLLCWLLCACPVPVLHPCKVLGLSWPRGQWEVAEDICRGGIRSSPVFPLTPGPSWQCPALWAALLCVPITPRHGLGLQDPFLHCISLLPPGPPLPCQELGKEMEQPQGWEGKGELVLIITGKSKQVLEVLGHHPRATAASLLCPVSSSPPAVQKSGPYSAQHVSPSHYNDKGDKRFLSQCSASI